MMRCWEASGQEIGGPTGDRVRNSDGKRICNCNGRLSLHLDPDPCAYDTVDDENDPCRSLKVTLCKQVLIL